MRKEDITIGKLHMTNIPAFKSMFKPFHNNGCEFTYGSPPRDEQCTLPPAFEIKSTIQGRNTNGKYLVCEYHKDELFNHIKKLDENATIVHI